MFINVAEKNKLINIYTWDTETDPFEYGCDVKPFTTCLYDGLTSFVTWGKDCIAQFIEYLKRVPVGYIYAHNGGRFDFFWLLPYVDFTKDILIIKNRFVQMTLVTGHIFRDSYKILPFPLSAYQKDEIDYSTFKRKVREKHKSKIIEYMKGDCIYLYELVKSYIETLDASITVGGTAYKKLTKMYDVDFALPEKWDAEIRNFYYGGRVERKFIGVKTGKFYVCDLNSSYPNAMKNYKHPLGEPKIVHKLDDSVFFAQVTGKNRGAFSRPGEDGIRYDYDYGTFNVTIHELNTAIKHDLFSMDKLEYGIAFDDSITFEDFVDKFYGMRNFAKQNGDKIRYILFKYLLNNAYGRFSINPENYKDWKLLPMDAPVDMRRYDGTAEDDLRWELEMVILVNGVHLYSRPTTEVKLQNVAIGASITGAARATLLEGIAKVGRYYYCDTDSLICDAPDGLELSDEKLGAWKIEGIGDRLAIGGKKMYAIFDTERMDKKCTKGCIHFPRSKRDENLVCDGTLKQATKGVKLMANQIVKVAMGEKITYKQDAPVFGFDGTKFIAREIVAR
jgi:hypothetical protein